MRAFTRPRRRKRRRGRRERERRERGERRVRVTFLQQMPCGILDGGVIYLLLACNTPTRTPLFNLADLILFWVVVVLSFFWGGVLWGTGSVATACALCSTPWHSSPFPLSPWAEEDEGGEGEEEIAEEERLSPCRVDIHIFIPPLSPTLPSPLPPLSKRGPQGGAAGVEDEHRRLLLLLLLLSGGLFKRRDRQNYSLSIFLLNIG